MNAGSLIDIAAFASQIGAFEPICLYAVMWIRGKDNCRVAVQHFF